MWESSRGFEGGASKKDIFLHGAAVAGYTNGEADAFLATLPQVTPPVTPAPVYDTVGGIMAYENGELDQEGIIELFQALVNSGLAWQLQGSYGRTAKALIDAGEINAL
jgi:hypothetical protein